MKKLVGPPHLNSESGQAFVEYILVLTVVVAVALGLLYQFNSAFKVYAQNYFGEYLTCLLEAGELPSLGGGAGSCDGEFQAFNIENGRPLLSGGSGSSSEGAPPTAGGSSSDSDQKKGAGSEGEQRSGATTASDGGTSTSSGSGSSSFFDQRGKPQQARANPPKGNQEGSTDSPDPFAKARTSKMNKNYSQPDELKPLKMEYSLGRDIASESTEDLRKPVSINRNSGSDLKKKKLRQDLVRKRAGDGDLKEDDFSFGDFLRFLIIAAILIGIVFFLGTQVLNFSKSYEK